MGGALLLAVVLHVVAATSESPALLDDGAELGEGKGGLFSKIATNKPAGPLVAANTKEFTLIPNFFYAGMPANVKNRDACRKKCVEHAECRSFSYKSTTKKCFWSTGSIRYNNEWDFYSKEYDLDGFGRMVPTSNFNKFNGLFAIDKDQNMKTVHGKNVDECKSECNDDSKCLSFSYHEGEHACLMGISKVEYSAGWSYYERNKAPAVKGGKWLPYPLRLDAYHAKQRQEELKTLKLFAERDEKVRVKKERKAEIVKKRFVYMKKKSERLSKEEKVKQFAREQVSKKKKVRKDEYKEDKDAAREKGKFDEAYHKQAEKNKELLHKRKMESNVKAGMREKAKQDEVDRMKKFQAHLAKMKNRGLNEIANKNRVTVEKERSVKLARSERAAEMKNDAFKVVQEERKFKSSVKNQGRVKKLKKKINRQKRKKWAAADVRDKAVSGELEAKRRIKMAKDERFTKVKIVKEKLTKKVKSGGKVPKTTKKTKLPEPPGATKKALRKRAPGVKGQSLNAKKTITANLPKRV